MLATTESQIHRRPSHSLPAPRGQRGRKAHRPAWAKKKRGRHHPATGQQLSGWREHRRPLYKDMGEQISIPQSHTRARIIEKFADESVRLAWHSESDSPENRV